MNTEHQLNTMDRRNQPSFTVENEALQVINTRGKIYKGNIALYRIACQCNAFKKAAADLKNTGTQQKKYQQACIIIADLLGDNEFLTKKITQQNESDRSKVPMALSLLANAFGRWNKESACRQAVMHIAQYLSQPHHLFSSYSPQSLANLANAFSKWSAGDKVFKTACQKIAEQLSPVSLAAFNSQALANLANAFGKWSAGDKVFKTACKEIAEQLSPVSLAAFNSQALANLANAFSKWSVPEDEVFKTACQEIAQQLSPKLLKECTPQALAKLANAFSKWSAPKDKVFKNACQEIAQRLLDNNSLLSDFNSQELANLANAFSKWSAPEDEVFKTACQEIAQQLSPKLLKECTPQALAKLANAFSKWSAPEADVAGDFKMSLQAIASHLIHTPMVIKQSNVLGISMLLKAYRQQAGWLHHDLAPRLIQRLENQIATENSTAIPFKAENLETFGNLVMGLYPFLGQQVLVDLKHRVLTVLVNLQPAIARQARYFLTAAADDTMQKFYQSRYPDLSFYQLITVYHRAAQELTAPQKATGADRARKITELTSWLAELLDNHGHAIINGSSNSWNKIAKLEAEYTENATDQLLDQFVQRHQATLPPATFNADWGQIFESLTDSPQPPAVGTSGKLTRQQYDAVGKHSVAAPARTIEYGLLGRLANGTLPVPEVRLPGYPSRHLIERLVYQNDVAFRMDLFGGNRMKRKSLTVDECLQQQLIENYDHYLPAQALQHYSAAGAALRQALHEQIEPLLTTVRQARNPDDLAARKALFFALTSGGIHGKSLVALPAADGKVHWNNPVAKKEMPDLATFF